MSKILEVKGLNKSYGDFSLTNVSFTLRKDCITGFIGVNGSGKTTTIRAILGLIKKSSGVIEAFGEDMATNENKIKNRIGVVLDEGYFYNNLTMDEMKGLIAPAYSDWKENDYLKYMDKFLLNPRQKIGTLSKGMRMKFALALALSHDADLLIMDEPTSGLDPLVRSQFLDSMKDYMKQGGKCVLFSTHITSDLDKVADILVLIHNGRILFELGKDALLDNHRLVKGDNKFLTSQNVKLFLNIHRTDYGFVGVTDRISKVKSAVPGSILERPTIEDVMLAYIERGDG